MYNFCIDTQKHRGSFDITQGPCCLCCFGSTAQEALLGGVSFAWALHWQVGVPSSSPVPAPIPSSAPLKCGCLSFA